MDGSSMMLIPPTFVKRDGRQLRMDAVHRNTVYLCDTQLGSRFLDVTTGSVFKLNYHPYTLVYKTRNPKLVLKKLGLNEGLSGGIVNLQYVREAKKYLSKLLTLSAVDLPSCIVPNNVIQLVEAFVRGVSTKELFQGAKTALNIQLPKMVQNYLNGGYHWEETNRSLECFVLQAIVEKGLILVTNR